MTHLHHDYIDRPPLESPDDMPDLAALLTSRICHDLISPLGAIGNGVELMAMASPADGPELTLIAESVTIAHARIRLFRSAFGPAAPGQMIARDDIQSLLADYGRITRHWTEFEVADDLPRADVKLLLLMLMCLETALPWGGAVHVTPTPTGYTLLAEADRIQFDAMQWSILTGAAFSGNQRPATVHFLLGAVELRRQARELHIHTSAQTVTLRLTS
ncbi:histidine phosphotransferase family protein [Roseinatronobacter alkalisoli]|uniref:Histidine phosphotransferase family protein n=1 Tax=Roseinatronobacter alkalisoli TaxID=3028235 RepID=A0ABT5T4Y8_9RHOB|nr:histidine phosphotransferase family protein [Roseinatronobacter sp. HJB301]MDD7970185.1 histidine phosphotransferase family protein [Roseinatronobacter sp. HJB301]